MSDTDQFRADLRTISEIAATARREVASGQVVDLGSLESLVDRVATASRDLTREESDSLRKAMLLLVAELDDLRTLVRTEHEALRGQLEGTGARRSAATAYGRPPGKS